MLNLGIKVKAEQALSDESLLDVNDTNGEYSTVLSKLVLNLMKEECQAQCKEISEIDVVAISKKESRKNFILMGILANYANIGASTGRTKKKLGLTNSSIGLKFVRLYIG